MPTATPVQKTPTSADIQIPGGWTSFRTMTPADKALFEKVIHNLLGVNYTPINVATQVVNGLNYCFLCTGAVVTAAPTLFNAMIHVYAPTQGEPHITEIKRLNP